MTDAFLPVYINQPDDRIPSEVFDRMVGTLRALSGCEGWGPDHPLTAFAEEARAILHELERPRERMP